MAIEEDPPAGVPEWVVTYGDMMSLLLTFFIMLVSLSEIQADEKYRAVLESVMKKMGYLKGPLAPEGKHFPLNALIEHMTKLGSHSDQQGKGGVKSRGLQGKESRVTRLRDGISVRDAVIQFPPGKLDLDDRQQEALLSSARRLSGKPHKLDIRGSVGTIPEKLESEKLRDPRVLAYERARLVATFLERNGVTSDRIKISSVGSHYRAINSNSGESTASNPDCVEIFVLDMYAEEFRGERVSP